MSVRITRLSSEPDMLGESPVWDARRGLLYRVDGFGRRVHALDPATGAQTSWTVPQMIGSIGLTEDEGTLVAALADGVYRLDLGTGGLSPVFLPDPPDPGVRFNDGKVARDGAFVCGSMGLHADPVGSFYCIDSEGSARPFASAIRIANAVCFSPDGGTVYFADSLSGRIMASDYVAGAGPVGEPRVLVVTQDHGSAPDGATVDAEGCLWVAMVQSGRIARFTPAGALDRMIEAPVDMPTCPAFGGPDLRTLYLTSIKDSGSGRMISSHPDGGHLFAIDGLGVQGLPEPLFRRAGSAAHPTATAP